MIIDSTVYIKTSEGGEVNIWRKLGASNRVINIYYLTIYGWGKGFGNHDNLLLVVCLE